MTIKPDVRWRAKAPVSGVPVGYRIWASSVHEGRFWAVCLSERCHGTAQCISAPDLTEAQSRAWVASHVHLTAEQSWQRRHRVTDRWDRP